MFKLLSMANNNTKRITRALCGHVHPAAWLSAVDKRLALIITCATFDEPSSVIQRLPNAKRDGNLLHKTLKKLGWEVRACVSVCEIMCVCVYVCVSLRVCMQEAGVGGARLRVYVCVCIVCVCICVCVCMRVYAGMCHECMQTRKA
jgi:hypothetical protein